MNNREILSENIEIFNDLTIKEQNLLLNLSTIKTFEKHQMIKTVDTGCSGLMFVKTGEIRVYLLSDEGRDITLYRLHEGEICIFSSMCVLNQINFDVFIEAMDDVEILQVGTAAISQLSKTNIKFENFLLNLTIERFNDVMWTMQQILFKSMDVRVATFLLDESVSRSSDSFKITHEEVAKYLGSAREVVTRTLKYFQTEHIVKLHRGGIEIIDKNKLKKVANK